MTGVDHEEINLSEYVRDGDRIPNPFSTFLVSVNPLGIRVLKILVFAVKCMVCPDYESGHMLWCDREHVGGTGMINMRRIAMKTTAMLKGSSLYVLTYLI